VTGRLLFCLAPCQGSAAARDCFEIKGDGDIGE
jgi:hypothetical protein